jgi:hypothetical protein
VGGRCVRLASFAFLVTDGSLGGGVVGMSKVSEVAVLGVGEARGDLSLGGGFTFWDIESSG